MRRNNHFVKKIHLQIISQYNRSSEKAWPKNGVIPQRTSGKLLASTWGPYIQPTMHRMCKKRLKRSVLLYGKGHEFHKFEESTVRDKDHFKPPCGFPRVMNWEDSSTHKTKRKKHKVDSEEATTATAKKLQRKNFPRTTPRVILPPFPALVTRGTCARDDTLLRHEEAWLQSY